MMKAKEIREAVVLIEIEELRIYIL